MQTAQLLAAARWPAATSNGAIHEVNPPAANCVWGGCEATPNCALLPLMALGGLVEFQLHTSAAIACSPSPLNWTQYS